MAISVEQTSSLSLRYRLLKIDNITIHINNQFRQQQLQIDFQPITTDLNLETKDNNKSNTSSYYMKQRNISYSQILKCNLPDIEIETEVQTAIENNWHKYVTNIL